MTFKKLTPAFLALVLMILPACEQRAATDQDAATQSAETASAPDSVRYQGIDVSHFQGTVDWTAVKAAGITFAFAKATQGDTEVDPEFTTNWAGIKAAGLVRGAYHFFDPSVDAEAQARHFIATVQRETGDLPPVLDIEVTEGVSAEGIDADIRTWLMAVEKAFGVKPIIYSDPSFINTNLPSGFNTYPLWIADYSETPPAPPGDWDAWLFWQYSQTGSVNGVDGNVDRDVYEGTTAQWDELVGTAGQ